LTISENKAEQDRVLEEIERQEAERLNAQLAQWERNVEGLKQPVKNPGAAAAYAAQEELKEA